jgi:hypothetical protein
MSYEDREYEVVVKTWKDGTGWGRTETYLCPNLSAARERRALERRRDPEARVFIRDPETFALRG